jgi:hypothetical protein
MGCVQDIKNQSTWNVEDRKTKHNISSNKSLKATVSTAQQLGDLCREKEN